MFQSEAVLLGDRLSRPAWRCRNVPEPPDKYDPGAYMNPLVNP